MKAIQVVGESVISLNSTAIEMRNDLIAEAREIGRVDDEFLAESALNVRRKIEETVRAVEACRVEVKAPVIAAGRLIDSMAKEFSGPIENELTRIKGLLNGYATEQRRIVEEAQRNRRIELERIEREKKEVEANAQKEAEAAGAADEAARKAREELESSFCEDEVKSAQDAELKAKAEAEIAAANARRFAEEKAKLQSESLQLEKRNFKPAIASREVWKFEVLDLKAVFAANPALVRMEIVTSEVNKAISCGARDIPGLRIWSQVEAK